MELLPDESLKTLLAWAARVCAACIRVDALADEECPDPLLRKEGGVFVTLTRRGALAGCIGFLQSSWPLWQTAARAARGAALEDPRFPRLAPEALPEIEVEISVLTPSVPIEASQVEVGRHGLLIDCDGRRGLLLPQVAIEHHLDQQAFLDALAQKAGLPPGAWRRDDCRLEAFQAQLAKGPLLELSGGGGEGEGDRGEGAGDRGEGAGDRG